MKKLLVIIMSLTILFTAPTQNANASTVTGMAEAISQTAEQVQTERHVHQITVNEPSTFEKIMKGIAGVFVVFWVGFVGFHVVD